MTDATAGCGIETPTRHHIYLNTWSHTAMPMPPCPDCSQPMTPALNRGRGLCSADYQRRHAAGTLGGVAKIRREGRSRAFQRKRITKPCKWCEITKSLAEWQDMCAMCRWLYPWTEGGGRTDDGIVDMVAVSRAANGERMRLSAPEVAEVARKMRDSGASITQTAEAVQLSDRRVSQLRLTSRLDTHNYSGDDIALTFGSRYVGHDEGSSEITFDEMRHPADRVTLEAA